MMLQYICILLFCMAACRAQVEKWHRSKIREFDPQVDFEKCGRSHKSWICDPNRILKTEEEADQIDALISRVANTTDCPCSNYFCDKDDRGYRIAVALVPKMMWDVEAKGQNRPSEETLLDGNLHEAKLFAYDLLQNWNVGRCKEEVIIFYCLNDNVLYTMTGAEANKKLTTSHIGEISLLVRKYFNPGGNIFEGLRSLITEYKRVFDGKYRPMTVDAATPQSPQAVVGGGAASITALYMMSAITMFTLLLFC